MTALNSPHDRFFKAVFGRAEVAAEFLARYLPPAVAATLDWATLRAEKEGSTGLDFIRSLLRYVAQVASTDRLSDEELRQAVTRALSGGGELMMTIAEQWE